MIDTNTLGKALLLFLFGVLLTNTKSAKPKEVAQEIAFDNVMNSEMKTKYKIKQHDEMATE